MSKEAMKLALEALENLPEMCGIEEAITALREALAEQETVLPGGGHVPAVPVAVYGYCPECGGAGVMRERRPNGDDKCTNGHKYPSSKALAEQPAQQEPVGKVNELFDEAVIEQCGFDRELLVYTSPPAQRTWQGLTDEDIDYLCELAYENDEELILTVQAKLKEKNT